MNGLKSARDDHKPAGSEAVPTSQPTDAGKAPGAGHRTAKQNIAAILVLLALLAGGLLLFVELRSSLRMEACIESGRRNCAPIEAGK
jgi:hypothetical protein